MSFKKFSEYLNEKKKPKPEDIEEVEVPKPDANPNEPLACPKCGSSKLPCECYTDDYYNAKLSQQAPRPNKLLKPKKKKDE
jgi:hypothetical protein